MFSVPLRVVVCRFSAVVLLLLLVLPGLTPISMPGSVASADPNIPRSYAEFINGAYMGALGRGPSCAEAQAEYDALVNAASSGTLNQEARRFVSTLFETQDSFNARNLTTYCQTPEYESLNPAFCNPLVGTGSAAFLTDLYQAFLFREPDSPGFNFWLNNNNGRKHLLLAFEDSGEFGTLVSNLFPGSRPCSTPRCDVTVDPDPMVLVSFGFVFLDSGTMRADTGPFPCLFVADHVILQDPISAFPLNGLLLPFDDWFVFDNGGLIPFSPFTAVGSIGFLAFNGQDLTAKQGTIFLTVFDGFGFGFGGDTGIQGAVTGVPVTGEYTTTKMQADGTTSTQTATRPFFRDRQGRIRQERGDLVIITDPIAGVRYVLNSKDKTAHRIVLEREDRNSARVGPQAGSGPNMTSLSEGKSLGRRRMDGVEAAGQEYTSVVPTGSKLGNRDPLPVTYQVWRSEKLGLPLSVRIQDALNGETSIQFKLLQKGVEPDARLFAVPEGYRVVDAKPVARRGQTF